MRVMYTSPSPACPAPFKPLRVISPTPSPTDPPTNLSAQVPTIISLSPKRPEKKLRPEIRKLSHYPDMPKNLEVNLHQYNTRFGQAVHHITLNVSMERYAHHIASIVAPPPASGKQPSLHKILKVPEAKIWNRSNFNEWSRLIHNIVRK